MTSCLALKGYAIINKWRPGIICMSSNCDAYPTSILNPIPEFKNSLWSSQMWHCQSTVYSVFGEAYTIRTDHLGMVRTPIWLLLFELARPNWYLILYYQILVIAYVLISRSFIQQVLSSVKRGMIDTLAFVPPNETWYDPIYLGQLVLMIVWWPIPS